MRCETRVSEMRTHVGMNATLDPVEDTLDRNPALVFGDTLSLLARDS